MVQEHKDNWLDRKTFKCLTCIWYTAKAGNIGRCKRHAPTMNGFPVVYSSDYCGDHKLDHTKIPHPSAKKQTMNSFLDILAKDIEENIKLPEGAELKFVRMGA